MGEIKTKTVLLKLLRELKAVVVKCEMGLVRVRFEKSHLGARDISVLYFSPIRQVIEKEMGRGYGEADLSCTFCSDGSASLRNRRKHVSKGTWGVVFHDLTSCVMQTAHADSETMTKNILNIFTGLSAVPKIGK